MTPDAAALPVGRRGYSQIQTHFLSFSDLNLNQNTMSIVHITNDNFETDVLKADKPVLVDFWAEWCGPCKAIAPILDQVASEYADRVQIAKVNVDEAGAIAQKYGIRSIPTLMVFKNGAPQAQHVGALSKNQLTQLLDAQI